MTFAGRHRVDGRTVIAGLADLTKGAVISGVIADGAVTVVDVTWHGSDVLTLTYRTAEGAVAERLIYREDEPRLAIVEEGKPWAFDGDGEAFKLASEAKRIDLAYLFDPYVAVSTSMVEALPHQITAVYEAMLPRQPLNFLLADDPGAGKTIMTGLYIRELIVRGDLRRCLIVTPGSLVDQWQAEMADKFHLDFTILTRDRIENSASGNPFADSELLIARLDKLSRDEDLQLVLDNARDWDLIVFDEAACIEREEVADRLVRDVHADGIDPSGGVSRFPRACLAAPCRYHGRSRRLWSHVHDAFHTSLVMAGLMAGERVRTAAAEGVCNEVDVTRLDLVDFDHDLAVNLVQRDPVGGPNLKLVGGSGADIGEHEEDRLTRSDRDLARHELKLVVHADDDHARVGGGPEPRDPRDDVHEAEHAVLEMTGRVTDKGVRSRP